MPDERRAVLIVGMHRSGTSALTRVLNIVGCDLPSRLLEFDPQDKLETNVSGFWEAIDVRTINDRFFERLGLRWHSIAPMPKGAFVSEAAEEAHESIVAYLVANVKVGSTILIKDPRISRMMPIWTEALVTAGIAPTVLISLRHPTEVARSLHQRNTMRYEYAYVLWLRHYLEAEALSRAFPRAFASYDALVADWRATSDKSLRALGLPALSASTEMEAAIDRFLRPGSAPADRFQSRRAPQWAEDLYQLMTAATGHEALDIRAVDKLATEIAHADDMYGLFYEVSTSLRSDRAIDYLASNGTKIMDDYEGRRVKQPGSHMVWFVMNGQRRYIPSPRVYEALFHNVEVIELDNIDDIARGQDFEEGTCLVQADDGGSIYLVTSSIQTGACKHLITNYRSFETFGFALNAVRRVPELLIQSLPWGPELRSTPSHC